MKMPWYLVAWVLVIEVVIVLIFVPGDFTTRAIKQESQLIEKHLGKDTRKWVTDKADAWYQSSVIDSGFYTGLHRTFIPTQEEKDNSLALESFGSWWFDFLSARINTFTKVIYQFYLRTAQFYLWMPYMLILLVPSLFDGFMTWRIKQTNFDYASPVVHRYSARAVFFLVVGAFLISFFPIVITPILMPILMMLWSVAAGLMVGNYQKRV